MPPPDRFRALMVTLPASRRSATPRRTATSYVALIARLVRWTAPGTMAVAAAAAVTPRARVARSGRAVGSSTGAARVGVRRSVATIAAGAARSDHGRRRLAADDDHCEHDERQRCGASRRRSGSGHAGHPSRRDVGRRLVVRSARLLHPVRHRSIARACSLTAVIRRSTWANCCHRGRDDTLWPRPWSELRHLMRRAARRRDRGDRCQRTLRGPGPPEPSRRSASIVHSDAARRAATVQPSRAKSVALLAIVTRRAGPATADTGGDGRRGARHRRSGRRTRAAARDRGAAAGPPAAQRSRRPRVVPARRDGLPRRRASRSRSRCPTATARGRRARPPVRRARRADRAARRGHAGCRAARPGSRAR